MEHFFKLPVEKQYGIIDASLSVFGKNGYKKTSVADIAAAAGISKSMVFHYFGSKKALYLYLLRLCSEIISNEIKKNASKNITDFFDKILMTAKIKISVMKKHVYIPLFLNSVYFETDPEVKDDIKDILNSDFDNDYSINLVFEDMNTEKFKNDIDPQVVYRTIIWFTYGYMDLTNVQHSVDYDKMYNEFKECVLLMKKNFYKRRYL